MAESNVIELNEDNFSQEVLESDVPVLVDFWAPWCAPCKQMSPVIEEIANSAQGQLKVGSLNVDENVSVASKYGIRSIPAILIFKNGEVVDQQIGLADKQTLLQKAGL